jgi:hypothetical protein
LEEWREMGLPLTVNCWLRIRNAILKANGALSKNLEITASEGINEFVAKLKKGSKRIRKIFDAAREKNLILSNQNFFVSFKKIVNCVPSNIEYLCDWVSIWNLNCLSNDLKFFIFQCRFNYLPTNNRLHSYIKEVDPRCTFCRIENTTTEERDSFFHCFFSCPTVKVYLTQLFLLIDLTFDDSVKTTDLYWYGILDNDDIQKHNVLCYLIVFDIFRYIVYKYRLRRVLPTFNTVVTQLRYVLSIVCTVNKNIHSAFIKIPSLANIAPAMG